MGCPTCSHTMQCFGSLGNCWCPRCGSIVRVGGELAGVPKLVERCRQFEDTIRDYEQDVWEWRRLGIAESIRPAGERS